MSRINSNGQTVVGALDSDGNFFPLESCRQEITKDENGNVTQIVATFGAENWKQVYTYSATTIDIGQWVKQ